MQKLWRRDYKFNVNKYQLPLARFYKKSLWNGNVQSFKSTTHDIIEFNPVFLVIVASHIRPRAMINASFTSLLRISVKDCDHSESQPDVWGNNDRQHRIKPLISDWLCGQNANNHMDISISLIKPVTRHMATPSTSAAWSGLYMPDQIATSWPNERPPLSDIQRYLFCRGRLLSCIRSFLESTQRYARPLFQSGRISSKICATHHFTLSLGLKINQTSRARND